MERGPQLGVGTLGLAGTAEGRRLASAVLSAIAFLGGALLPSFAFAPSPNWIRSETLGWSVRYPNSYPQAEPGGWLGGAWHWHGDPEAGELVLIAPHPHITETEYRSVRKTLPSLHPKTTRLFVLCFCFSENKPSKPERRVPRLPSYLEKSPCTAGARRRALLERHRSPPPRSAAERGQLQVCTDLPGKAGMDPEWPRGPAPGGRAAPRE